MAGVEFKCWFRPLTPAVFSAGVFMWNKCASSHYHHWRPTRCNQLDPVELYRSPWSPHLAASELHFVLRFHQINWLQARRFSPNTHAYIHSGDYEVSRHLHKAHKHDTGALGDLHLSERELEDTQGGYTKAFPHETSSSEAASGHRGLWVKELDKQLV